MSLTEHMRIAAWGKPATTWVHPDAAAMLIKAFTVEAPDDGADTIAAYRKARRESEEI